SKPPADLGRKSLPLERIEAGVVLFRIHNTNFGAKFFGKQSKWRFDSPDRSFGTLYAAMSAEVAFAETLGRGQGSLISQAELDIRSICRFTLVRPIHLVR